MKRRRKRHKSTVLVCGSKGEGCVHIPVHSRCSCGAYLCHVCLENHLRKHAGLPPIRRDDCGMPNLQEGVQAGRKR